MDQQRVEGLVREILLELGENPDREGLQDTPRRVASMFQEVFAGIRYTNAEIASMCDRKFRVETTDPIIIRDIPCFSYCEHHMALMYNMKITIGYVPQGYVLGLSKFPRIADLVCRRLQLQERIGLDIADILEMILGIKDIGVIVSAEHSCVTARGIQKPGSVTTTTVLRGTFKDNWRQLLNWDK